MIEGILSTYVRDAKDIELSGWTPKPNTLAGEPLEALHELHSQDGLDIGIWECTPGEFRSAKDGISELMVFTHGAGTITPDGADPVEIRPGASIITPDGWTGAWEITEAVRKIYVIWKT